MLQPRTVLLMPLFHVCCSALIVLVEESSVLQRVAECCSVLQCVCRMLQPCTVLLMYILHVCCAALIALVEEIEGHKITVFIAGIPPGLRRFLGIDSIKAKLINVGLNNTVRDCNAPQHTAAHYNTLQHTANSETCASTIMHLGATHRNKLQHTATNCNTLQHTLQHNANSGAWSSN